MSVSSIAHILKLFPCFMSRVYCITPCDCSVYPKFMETLKGKRFNVVEIIERNAA
jgi:hypothetical protein